MQNISETHTAAWQKKLAPDSPSLTKKMRNRSCLTILYTKLDNLSYGEQMGQENVPWAPCYKTFSIRIYKFS